MESVHLIIRIVHITAGGMALLSGLAAILLRNKTKQHRKLGKLYFWCMSIIFVTALYLAYLKLNLFLWCVACFSYYSAVTAYRSLRLKHLHKQQKPLALDWIIELFFGLMHLSFVAFAIYLLVKGNTSFGIISLVFGGIGLRSNAVTIKRLRGKIKHSSYWLQAHAGGMLGSYIATITAFTVNNNSWMGLPDVLAWLGPTAILVPFLVFELRKIRNKQHKAL